MRRRSLRALPVVPLLAVVVLATGCASTHLHKQAFEGRRIAVIAAFPPKAVVENQRLVARGYWSPEPGRIEEDQTRRLQQLLDAATERVDLAERMAREALVVGADELGATIADDPEQADYVLDLRVYHYGLLMASYTAEANFYIDVELLIRDRATDEVIWQKHMDRFGNYETRLTSGDMVYMTEDAMAQELAKFAAFAARNMTASLTRNIKTDES